MHKFFREAGSATGAQKKSVDNNLDTMVFSGQYNKIRLPALSEDSTRHGVL